MNIIWTQEAKSSVSDIYHYLSVDQQAPQAARDTLNRLFDGVDQLESMPLSGPQLADYQPNNVREKLVAPYRVIYLVDGQSLYVLSIMHQRQLLPKVSDMKAAARDAIKLLET